MISLMFLGSDGNDVLTVRTDDLNLCYFRMRKKSSFWSGISFIIMYLGRCFFILFCQKHPQIK